MSLNVRVSYIVWLDVKFCLEFTLAARKVARHDFTSALLMGCVVGANLDHLDQRPEDTRRFGALGSPRDEDRHPVNAKSLSDALSVPRETVRAKIGALVSAGVLRRVDQGVILPTATIQSPEVVEMSRAGLAALADLVGGLGSIAACGIDRGHHLAQPVLPMAGAMIRLSAGHVVRGIIQARNLMPELGLVDVIVFFAVAHLSGRDPHGAFRGPPAPTSQRSNRNLVRGSAVASFLDMSDATVRRHLNTLVDHGRLMRIASGYSLPLTGGQRLFWEEFHYRASLGTAQFIWRLRQCGVLASTEPGDPQQASGRGGP